MSHETPPEPEPTTPPEPISDARYRQSLDDAIYREAFYPEPVESFREIVHPFPDDDEFDPHMETDVSNPHTPRHASGHTRWRKPKQQPNQEQQNRSQERQRALQSNDVFHFVPKNENEDVVEPIDALNMLGHLNEDVKAGHPISPDDPRLQIFLGSTFRAPHYAGEAWDEGTQRVKINGYAIYGSRLIFNAHTDVPRYRIDDIRNPSQSVKKLQLPKDVRVPTSYDTEIEANFLLSGIATSLDIAQRTPDVIKSGTEPQKLEDGALHYLRSNTTTNPNRLNVDPTYGLPDSVRRYVQLRDPDVPAGSEINDEDYNRLLEITKSLHGEKSPVYKMLVENRKSVKRPQNSTETRQDPTDTTTHSNPGDHKRPKGNEKPKPMPESHRKLYERMERIAAEERARKAIEEARKDEETEK